MFGGNKNELQVRKPRLKTMGLIQFERKRAHFVIPLPANRTVEISIKNATKFPSERWKMHYYTKKFIEARLHTLYAHRVMHQQQSQIQQKVIVNDPFDIFGDTRLNTVFS